MNDKMLHFCAGFVIAAVFGVLVSPPIGAYVAISIGAAKESYDYTHPKTHTADILDFAYMALGGILGAIAVGVAV